MSDSPPRLPRSFEPLPNLSDLVDRAADSKRVKKALLFVIGGCLTLLLWWCGFQMLIALRPGLALKHGWIDQAEYDRITASDIRR